MTSYTDRIIEAIKDQKVKFYAYSPYGADVVDSCIGAVLRVAGEEPPKEEIEIIESQLNHFAEIGCFGNRVYLDNSSTCAHAVYRAMTRVEGV